MLLQWADYISCTSDKTLIGVEIGVEITTGDDLLRCAVDSAKIISLRKVCSHPPLSLDAAQYQSGHEETLKERIGAQNRNAGDDDLRAFERTVRGKLLHFRVKLCCRAGRYGEDCVSQIGLQRNQIRFIDIQQAIKPAVRLLYTFISSPLPGKNCFRGSFFYLKA